MRLQGRGWVGLRVGLRLRLQGLRVGLRVRLWLRLRLLKDGSLAVWSSRCGAWG